MSISLIQVWRQLYCISSSCFSIFSLVKFKPQAEQYKMFNINYLLGLSVLLSVNSVLSAEETECARTCSDQRIETRLETIESILSEVPERLKECSEGKRLRWSGNQSTLGEFRRLSTEVKGRLKEFRLQDTDDLDMTTLLQYLRPCPNLEVIHLENVELIGNFPNTTESKLYLPKLHDLRLMLANYPNLGAKLVDHLIFAKKSELQSIDLRKLAQIDLNVFVSVGGWMKFAINHEYGELILNTLLNVDTSYAELLNATTRSETFDLKRLTLDSIRTISTGMIPSDLSYLHLNWVRFNDEIYQLPEYAAAVEKQTRLKELHLRLEQSPGANQPQLDFKVIPKTVKRLSIAQIKINSSSARFLDLEEVLFNNCEISDLTVTKLGRMFNFIKKFAVVPSYFHSSSYGQCHPILDQILNAYNKRLSWIMMGNCYRKFPNEKPKDYDTVEKILDASGLPKDATNFILEKIDENWVGTKITAMEVKEIAFKMGDTKKVRSWEREMY